jgi:hypothetical protein
LIVKVLKVMKVMKVVQLMRVRRGMRLLFAFSVLSVCVSSAARAQSTDADTHLTSLVRSADTFIKQADREITGGDRGPIPFIDVDEEKSPRHTPAGDHLRTTFRSLLDARRRVAQAMKSAASQPEVLATLESNDDAEHPRVLAELGKIRSQMEAAQQALKPHLTVLDAEQQAVAALLARVDRVAAVVEAIEAAPPGQRRAALQAIDVAGLQGDIVAGVSALRGVGGKKGVFFDSLKLADEEPKLATGTISPAGSTNVVPFQDDERAFRRYRFLITTVIMHHLSLDILLAGALQLERAAIVQKKWSEVGPALAPAVVALEECCYGANPIVNAYVRHANGGDVALNRKLAIGSVQTAIAGTFYQVHFSGPGGRDLLGRPNRKLSLPLVDGSALAETLDAKSSAGAATGAGASADADGVRRVRQLAIDAATREGFHEIVHERKDEWQTRYPSIFLGTPSIPGSASEVLIVFAAEPKKVSDTAIIELDSNVAQWSGKAVVLLRAPAAKFKNRQLFGHAKVSGDAKVVGFYVMVFAR